MQEISLNQQYSNHSQQQQHQLDHMQFLNQHILSTSSPSRQSRPQTVLSNVTNNIMQSSPQNTHKSSPKMHSSQQRLSPNFNSNSRKSVILEQENQILKTQVEFLKAALLGVCKDKQVQVPLPLLQESSENMSLQEFQTFASSLFQNINSTQVTGKELRESKSPYSPSKMPKQMMQGFSDLSAINQRDENSISKLSICSSPATKSIHKRRKRSQRKGNGVVTPIKSCENGANTVLGTVGTGHCLRDELPLQIQYRRATDDTLVFDKSMDVVKVDTSNNNFEEAHNDKLNNDEAMDNEQENEQNHHDTSQIQIKYAKMLEELENESLVQEENEVPSPEKQNQFLPIIPFDNSQIALTVDLVAPAVQEQIEPSSSAYQTRQLVKVKSSTQFEQKQFLEKELTNLKTELEQFEQEEEKILSMIMSTSSNKPSAQNSVLRKSKGHIVEEHNDIINIIDVKYSEPCQTQRLPETLESFVEAQKSQNGCHQQYCQVTEYSETTQEQMLKNLQEAYLYLREIHEDPDDSSLIKPIRILSPQCAKIPEIIKSQQKLNRERYNRTPVIDKDSFIANQNLPFVSPIKYDVSGYNLMSADKNAPVAETENSKSPFYEKFQNAYCQKEDVSQTAFDISSNFIVGTTQLRTAQQSSSKKSNVHMIKRQRTNQSNNKAKKSQSRERDSTHQFSVQNILSSMANDCKQNISPLRHYQKFYPSAASQVNVNTEESTDHDKTRIETLDILAKRQSLVHGLKQQEEPPEEDEEEFPLKSKQQQVLKTPQRQQNTYRTEEDEVRLQESEDYNNRVLQSNKSQHKTDQQYFYGVYDIEKSEQLKQQRNQSIKRAEELLQHFLNEQVSTKRPDFIGNFKRREEDSSPINEQTQNTGDWEEQAREYTNVKQQREEQNIQEIASPYNDKYSEEDQNNNECEEQAIHSDMIDQIQTSQMQIVNAPTLIEMSFQDGKSGGIQENNMTKQIVRESTRSSMMSHQYELINLEISPDKPSTQNIQCEIYTQDFQTFDTPIGEINTARQSQNNGIQNQKQVEMAVIKPQPVQISKPEETFEPKILNQRRKSMETGGLTSKLSAMLLQPKRKNLQLRKLPLKSKEDDSKNMLLSTQGLDSQFQTFANNSLSCEKMKKQKAFLSKTIENGRNSSANNTNTFQTPSNNYSKLSQKQNLQNVEEPQILQYTQYTNQQQYDPELLYEQRSKSVIKRREELLKKKQNDTLHKIEAKYHKMEQFKSTRNGNNRLQSNQRMNSSQEKLNTHVFNQYNSKQKSRISNDSTSHTPLRANKDHKSFDPYQTSNDACVLSQQSMNKSNSKPIIKFEKRRLDEKSVNNFHPQTTLITPMNGQLTKLTAQTTGQPPSSSQSKRSNLVSECSSYRKKQQQEDQFQKTTVSEFKPNATQDRRSKKPLENNNHITNLSHNNPSCNLLYKKQQQQQQHQHNLKQSIVNRTIRMSQATTTKEYIQMKATEKSRLTNNGCDSTQDKSIVSGSSQSFVGAIPKQQHQPLKKSLVRESIGATVHKQLNSSRSASKINNAQQIQMQKVESQYQSISQKIDEESNNRGECKNCQRLISKGLSTDFCLEHYGTPRYIDD